MVQNTRHFNYFKAEKNKNVIHQAGGRRPRAVRKTSGTVFPNTDRHRLVNNIFIFFLQQAIFEKKPTKFGLQSRQETGKVLAWR